MHASFQDYLVRKERENYLLFNYKDYKCFLLNDTGYAILQRYTSSSITEIADLLGLEEERVIQFIKILQDITTDDVRINREKDIRGTIPSKYADLKAPIRTTWLITRRCNLMCKHCYVGGEPSNEFKELPFMQVKAVLRKLADAGVFVIYFTGGEPFVRQDFMEILEVTSDLGFKIGISTNGLLLNKSVIEKLSDLNVIKIQISLDGAKKDTHEFIRGTNTFEQTICSIKGLVESNIPTGITFVCHKGNIHELEEIIQLAGELKVKGIKISPLMDWGRAKHFLSDYIPAFEERAKLTKRILFISKKLGVNLLDELHVDVGIDENPYGCPLVMGFTLLPNGDVIPCEVFAENINREIIMGNLVNQSVEEIWESPKAKIFRDAASIVNKKNCNVCPYLDTCGSYCIAEIYLKHKKLAPPREYFRKCKAAWQKDFVSSSGVNSR